jgi:hypothetical protein
MPEWLLGVYHIGRQIHRFNAVEQLLNMVETAVEQWLGVA